MTSQLSRMRRAISGLSRADLRRLANDVGISRDDLSDFADIGGALPDDTMAKLRGWHDTFSLRARLNDHRSVHQFHAMVEETGIDRVWCSPKPKTSSPTSSASCTASSALRIACEVRPKPSRSRGVLPKV